MCRSKGFRRKTTNHVSPRCAKNLGETSAFHRIPQIKFVNIQGLKFQLVYVKARARGTERSSMVETYTFNGSVVTANTAVGPLAHPSSHGLWPFIENNSKRLASDQ